jgi:putative peptidoglycan lipid II flippase
MRASLAASLRGVILLALPASLGLILLREPLVGLLYQRGQFDERALQLVAWPLLWYAAGLVGHSIMEVLTRAFYAQHDTKAPVLIGTAAMILNVVFSFVFSKWFEQIGWMPHGGLALANSLATALEAATLLIVMRVRLKGIEGKNILRGFAAASVAALGMSLALGWWSQAAGSLTRWIVGLGGVGIGGIVYGMIVAALRVPEVQMLTSALRRRLKK